MAWSRKDKQMLDWLLLCQSAFNNGNCHLMYDVFTSPQLSDCGYELLQFTGLIDKNGKDIYRGNIVSMRFYHFNSPSKRPKISFVTVNLPIIFEKGIFKPDDYQQRFTDYCTTYNNWYDQCEVIGNIYENPELISQK